MLQSGYDIWLIYFEDEVYFYVFIMDEVFEVFIIQDWGWFFINFIEVWVGRVLQWAFYMLGFVFNGDGYVFIFVFRDLFWLCFMFKWQKVSFFYQNEWYVLEVEVDENIVVYMEDYFIVVEI